MFDSLVYIPAILAYTFVMLLVVILGFIVIYIIHKIYATIYDNLPVAQLSSTSSTTITEKLKRSMVQPAAGVIVGGMAMGGIANRKSKTALRIIVTLEPCYLAYMLFKSECSSSQKVTASSNLAVSSSVAPTGGHNGCSLIKYYDDLSAIPTSRRLMRYADNIPNSRSKMQK